MNQPTHNNKEIGQSENTGNENANSGLKSPDREANPLFSDSVPVSNERGQSEDEKDEQIKNESDTARLRSERQSVLDNEKKKD